MQQRIRFSKRKLTGLFQAEENRMMTRQSMARVSSASPEADFAPGIPTHDWDAAPGAAARTGSKSGFSGNLERDADEVKLQFPPGRRPKDGFYLPYPREFGESPEVQVESGGNCTKPRKMFNLKFPGSSKKSSRMRLPFQGSSKPPQASQADEDRGFGIFSPSSGQRFGSSITNRMLMQFQKKQSLWRRCLPSKPEPLNGSSSYIYPNRGRRLDEGIDEGFITAVDSPVSDPSLPSSPHHGHRPSSNFSPVVKSSRFMASMLISLCSDDAADSQLEAEDGNSDDYNDEIGIPHSTTPRTKSSSPEAFEVEVDPASQTITLQETWTCTCRHRANMIEPVPQREKKSRSVARSLHEELATASRSPSDSRSGKLTQPRSGGTEDSAHNFNENNPEDSADAYAVFFKESSNRELLRSGETRKPSLAWKLSTVRNHPSQEPTADSVEPSDSEFGDEPIFDDEEEHGCRGRDTRIFPTGSDRSSSPEFNSLHKTVWPRPNYLTSKDVGAPVPISKNSIPHNMVGYLSPPRISIEDLEYTSYSDTPKAFARWKSIPEPSTFKRSSIEPGGSERKQSPVALKSASPLQNQSFQRSTTPSKIRIKDFKQTAKPSSLRPTPAKPLNDTDESAEDSECSTPSSGYQTPPSISSHMLPNFASPKPASSKLLNPNLHSQRRINPFVADQATTLPGPSFQQIMMARSHSVRSSSSRRFATQESCQADTTNYRGQSHPSRLAKTSSSSVMSKVALFESKAGESKSGPLTYSSSQ